MKFANLEGTTDEIKNFFQDNGLNAADYFQPAEIPIKTIWLVLPAACVLLALAVLVLVPSLTLVQQRFAFIVSCFSAIWWAVVIQVRFKNVWATGVVVVGCLLLALVSLGVVTPIQMLEEVKALKK